MLPTAQPFTAEHAERWRAAAKAFRYARSVLPLLWLAAIITAIAGPLRACTPDDPSICGPDAARDVAFTLGLATPLILIWNPLLGCLAGLAYGVIELCFDPELVPRLAFAAHGAFCLIGLIWLSRARAAQTAIVGEANGSLKSVVPSDLMTPRLVRRRSSFLVLALVLWIAGLMSFGWYLQERRQEAQHLARAATHEARVVDVDVDDSAIAIAISSGLDDSARRRIDVLDANDYKVGEALPVLLDPRDSSWIRLVSEPVDQGGWLGLAVAGWLLGGLVLLRDRARRHGLHELLRSPQPVLAVQAQLNESIDLELLPAGSSSPLFARFITNWGEGPSDEVEWGEPCRAEWDDDWDEEDEESFGSHWRGEIQDAEREGEPAPHQEAVVFGPLRYGGWVVLHTEGELLLPSRPLTVGRDDSLRHWWRQVSARFSALQARGPRLWSTKVDEPVEEASARAVPLGPAATTPALPVCADAPIVLRALGGLMLLAGGLGGPLVLAWSWNDDRFAAIGAVLVGGQLLTSGVDRLVRGVTISRPELTVREGRWTHHIPWDALHGVRQEGHRLFVAWKPVTILGVGPFARGEAAANKARELGSTMLRLREQSLALGNPQREAFSQLGPVWRLLPAYAMAIALTLWVIW